MDVQERLGILVDHWIEHNASHGEEFGKWAQRAEEAGLEGVAREIAAATERLEESTSRLREALALLGGSTHKAGGHHVPE
ncbi:MAG: hypothetical protein QGI83_11905 [Candidatus Latescibacteria bacterium]|jgi:hypothetical protein|nr:hypothetical protein [Candidatus Latescibacterota bacterium]